MNIRDEIDIEQIVSFYMNLINKNSKTEIIKNMQNFAREYLIWEKTMEKVFENIVNNTEISEDKKRLKGIVIMKEKLLKKLKAENLRLVSLVLDM